MSQQIETTQRVAQPLSIERERDLIKRSQERDMEATDELIRAYQDSVYGLAYRFMGDYDEAHDLAQEVFVVCFRKISQFRGESRLRTWLYRIVANMAKNAWKRKERRGSRITYSLDEPPTGEDSAPMREPMAPGPGPRDQAEGRETMTALGVCIEKLSPEHREALILRCMEQMSYEEIAETLDCNLGTVKSRINRAREQLRGMMKEYLGERV